MKIPPNRERGRQTERQRELFKQPVLMDSALLQVTDNVWIFSPQTRNGPRRCHVIFLCISQMWRRVSEPAIHTVPVYNGTLHFRRVLAEKMKSERNGNCIYHLYIAVEHAFILGSDKRKKHR